MPVRIKDRRGERRSRIPGFQYAEIEFTGPDGTAYKRPLIELSVSGGSFQLPEPISGLEVGTAFVGGVIRFGEFEVQVNFVIRRVTHDDVTVYEYGVQIYTMNDQDRNEIDALISQLGTCK